jgi:RNA polymerase sigma factor (sigma-70 family)
MSNFIESAKQNTDGSQTAIAFLASLPDADLLDTWINDGEKEAFAQLVQRYSGMVLSVCRRGCQTHSDADDAYQSTFLYLARNASKIRHRERLAGWLHRVAQRASVATYSAKKHESHSMIDPVDNRKDPLGQITQRHEAMILDEELAALPEHYRVALVLHIMEGQPLERMAEQLGTTIGAVRGQLQRGKQLLARRLRRRGLVPVLAIAASVASTVSTAQAKAASDTFLQTMDGPSIPEPPIDTSLLESFLHEGLRIMKAPLLSGVVATAAVLIALIAMTDDGIGGDNPQPATIQEVVRFPAMVGQLRETPPPNVTVVLPNGTAGVGQPAQVYGGSGVVASNESTVIERAVAPKPTSDIAFKAEEALNQVLPSQQDKLPLSDLAATLTSSLNVPVELDARAVAVAKLDAASTSVSIMNESLPLSVVLRKALQPLGLKAVVQDEGLVITSDLLAQVRSGVNASRWVNVDEEAEKAIAAALSQPVSMEFVEMPLKEALAVLAELSELPIEIDARSLEEIGLSADVPITLSKKNVKLRSVLADIVEQLDSVTYTVQNETLRVTSLEAAESHPLVRVYWLEGTGFPASDVSSLMELIQTSIDMETWEVIGGPSTISPMGNSIRPGIVVSTAYRTHHQIESLLSRLRDAHFGPDPVTEKVEVPMPPKFEGGMLSR